ncbi:MAG TPA: hypothetical protein PLU30_20525 [Verrucomicrobiae bacterium]|nr:hypothetical protein [Verrucomicrobiae bacterium]
MCKGARAPWQGCERGAARAVVGWCCVVSITLCLASAHANGEVGSGAGELRDAVARSLALPLAVQDDFSPTTAPPWMRAYLGDVEIAGAPDHAAEAALGHLRQAWSTGNRGLAEDILRNVGARMDHRPDFVLLEAEIRRSTCDIANLRHCLDKPGWETMRATRGAYRFWLDRDDANARATHSADIVRETTREPEGRLLVGTLLESWGWPDVAARVWILVAASDHPAHDYARTHVMNFAMRSGNTSLLLRLCDALLQRRPQDADIRFSRIYLTLLLRKKSAGLVEEATALHAAKPDSPAIAAVLAYCLFRHGNEGAAVKTLASVDPSALQNRPESLIGALVLEASNPARARALAEASGPFLKLPEEKVLFRSVLERLPRTNVN